LNPTTRGLPIPFWYRDYVATIGRQLNESKRLNSLTLAPIFHSEHIAEWFWQSCGKVRALEPNGRRK
jgi:hypothetical protein